MKKLQFWILSLGLLCTLILTGAALAVDLPQNPTPIAVSEEDTNGSKTVEEAITTQADPDLSSSITFALLSEGFESITFPPTGWGQTQLVGAYNWDRVTLRQLPNDLASWRYCHGSLERL